MRTTGYFTDLVFIYLFILFTQYLKRCTLLAEIFIDNLGSVLILRGGGIL